jgi:hypothetical protein
VAYGDLPITGVVPASGTLRIEIRPTGRQTWVVSQITVSMLTAPAGALCQVYKNSSVVVPLLQAIGDTASGDPPITLRHNETMAVVWTGATAGDVGSVFVVYDDGT